MVVVVVVVVEAAELKASLAACAAAPLGQCQSCRPHSFSLAQFVALLSLPACL